MELDRNRMIAFCGVIVFILLFSLAGMPILKKVRASNPDAREGLFDVTEAENYSFEGRPVQIDVSVEDMCQDIFTGEQNGRCTSDAGCREMCRSKGCSDFGLLYGGSSFDGARCLCDCFEENKIKKALGTGMDDDY